MCLVAVEQRRVGRAEELCLVAWGHDSGCQGVDG